MKYTIRRSLFETNSSSLHVISIGRERWDKLPKIVTFQPARYVDGEGGDPHTVEERASYLYTVMRYNSPSEEFLDRGKEFIVKTLKRHGIEAIFLWVNRKKKNYTYVYCDNLASLEDWLKRILSSEYLLMQYLFSPDSIVSTCWSSCHEEMTEEEEKKRYIDITLG